MKFKALWVLALLALLVISPASAAPPKPAREAALGWDITQVEVTAPGQTIISEEGTLITGYTLTGQARATAGGLLQHGAFQLVLSAFSPSRELPGQHVGKWYIVGQWSLTKSGAAPQSLRARHNPDVISGRIRTELDFNPTADTRNWSALATLPMSPAAGRWARGEGTFSIDSTLAGSLHLSALLWPEARGGGQQ